MQVTSSEFSAPSSLTTNWLTTAVFYTSALAVVGALMVFGIDETRIMLIG